MRCKTASPMAETTREERIAKLASFISGGVSSGNAASPELCLIARSIDSPVAKATMLALEAHGAPVPVRAILAGLDRKSLDGNGLTWDIRVLRSPRLLDAHEQMTVGTAIWHGDSLRRDADKRDLFEQYLSGLSSGEALAWTELSFARMWALAEPVAARAPQPSAVSQAAASLAATIAGEQSAPETLKNAVQRR